MAFERRWCGGSGWVQWRDIIPKGRKLIQINVNIKFVSSLEQFKLNDALSIFYIILGCMINYILVVK